MSFWKMDCTKLRSRPDDEPARDSVDPESSLWAAYSLHAANSTAAGPRTGSAARMQQYTFTPGATCSLDETDDQSMGFSVQQHAGQHLPIDDIARKHAEQSQRNQHQQLPAEELLLPDLSSFAPYSTDGDGKQRSVQCSFDGIGYTVEQQIRLPTVTPPASPARSEETVGCAPRWAAPTASPAEVTAMSGDPTDISSHWRATKKRRLAGASVAESQPHAQRSLDLADDAESNMPPPQPRARQKWHATMRKPALSSAARPLGLMAHPRQSLLTDWGVTSAAEKHAAFYQAPPSPQWDESCHPLPHPLDVEE